MPGNLFQTPGTTTAGPPLEPAIHTCCKPANRRRQRRTCSVHRTAGRPVLLHRHFHIGTSRIDTPLSESMCFHPWFAHARSPSRCLGPRRLERSITTGALTTRCQARGPVDRRDLPTGGVGCQRLKPRSGVRGSLSANGVNHCAGTRLTAPGCGSMSLSNNVNTSWSWNRKSSGASQSSSLSCAAMPPTKSIRRSDSSVAVARARPRTRWSAISSPVQTGSGSPLCDSIARSSKHRAC